MATNIGLKLLQTWTLCRQRCRNFCLTKVDRNFFPTLRGENRRQTFETRLVLLWPPQIFGCQKQHSSDPISFISRTWKFERLILSQDMPTRPKITPHSCIRLHLQRLQIDSNALGTTILQGLWWLQRWSSQNIWLFLKENSKIIHWMTLFSGDIAKITFSVKMRTNIRNIYLLEVFCTRWIDILDYRVDSYSLWNSYDKIGHFVKIENSGYNMGPVGPDVLSWSWYKPSQRFLWTLIDLGLHCRVY